MHPNRITGSRVKVILLNGWIWPIGGASLVEGLQSMGLPRLVFYSWQYLLSFGLGDDILNEQPLQCSVPCIVCLVQCVVCGALCIMRGVKCEVCYV